VDISDITSDPFWNLAFKKSAELKLEDSSGAIKKAEAIQDTYTDLVEEYLNKIKQMSDDEFEKLTLIRDSQLLELHKAMQESIQETDIFKNPEDLSAFSIMPEIAELNREKIEKKFDSIDLGDESYKKLFLLEFMARIELFSYLIIGLMNLDVKDRIESILKRNFDNDQNWSNAVSILAIQENLVKKKLETMGMSKNDIKEFLASKGNKFQNLVDHLEKKIIGEEKRTPSISFYKVQSLRDVRNKLEHDGYDVKITAEDVKDLLKDIEKFEKELFPNN
jgi:hypothetical protein